MNRELAKECLEALEGFVNDMERQSSWIYEEAIKQTKDLIARLRAAIEEPTRCPDCWGRGAYRKPKPDRVERGSPITGFGLPMVVREWEDHDSPCERCGGTGFEGSQAESKKEPADE